jgi:MFS family permease
MAFNPLFLAAMSDAKPDEAGLASGLVNTSFMMGGALGLAVLASLAASHTGLDVGAEALASGYRLAFAISAGAAILAAALALTLRVAHPTGDVAAPAVH